MKTMTGVTNNLVTEDEQDTTNKVCKSNKTSDHNDLGPYGDDSSSPSDSPCSDSDSDSSSIPSSDDDQIDLDLLHGLEAIHITVQRTAGQQDSEDQLIPKGPQKTHKVRKQGKSTLVPYTQGSSSVLRNASTGLPPYPTGGAGPPHYHQGNGTGDDNRVDMVLSESLNDPGFRDNLLYTLQAEVEQYPTLVTPPLSSSDCSYSADYTNSGYSSGSSVSGGGGCHSNAYYAQYTPESLHTASPHGSDASIEDEPYTTACSSTSVNSYQSGESSSYPPSSTPYSHHYHSHQDQTTDSRTSSTGSATSYYDQNNELCESAARSASNYYRNSTEDSSTSSGIANYYRNSEQSELSSPGAGAGVKPLSNAEKFIDNMCVGVKYFLASHKKHPGEPGEAYDITEDRTHSLLTLARVIQAKLDSLKEAEKMMAGAQVQCREEGYVNSPMPGSVYEYL